MVPIDLERVSKSHKVVIMMFKSKTSAVNRIGTENIENENFQSLGRTIANLLLEPCFKQTTSSNVFSSALYFVRII